MNGAELLVKTSVRAGIVACFANAGTTEIPIVSAFDTEPGIKATLGLFEGVCAGAADGYGRMLEKPAMVLFHLGPGLANGIANLHNASRARTPIVNLIGEHPTWHRAADAPLTMDIDVLASTVSRWFKTNESPLELSQNIAEAISMSMYGQVSSLIIPNDHQWAECIDEEISIPSFSFESVSKDSIKKAIELLRTHHKVGLLIGGRALRRRGLLAATRIKAATGCDLITTTHPAYVDRGIGLPEVVRIPYFPSSAKKLLSQYDGVVLVGVNEPVTFFGYEGINSYLLSDEQFRFRLDNDQQNEIEALEHLADELNAPLITKVSRQILSKSYCPNIPQGELNPEKICIVLAALQPENVIIVDEGITTSVAYYPLTSGLPSHSILHITGGSIGYGMPCAVGAAMACPHRPVVNLQADGSALYTIQALWTQAREDLNVTTLICSNRSYNIIRTELSRAGITKIGQNASSLIDLDRPGINWVKLAEGFGVQAVSVSTTEELSSELRKALSEPGPYLIEMMLVPPHWKNNSI
jgi:acetolactate synthase-1/2/3 large subunit